MRLDVARFALLWRYYQAGLVNMVVGYGLYAGFIRLGINLYLAQIVAHLLGMIFNYFSYSRHVFRGSQPAKVRFLLAYGLNYLVGLAALAGASVAVRSPYIDGIIAMACASLVNYFVLRHAVFRRPAA